MQTTQAKQFDIRNFTEVLTQTKRGRYICPNCNEPHLGIASSGKYQCFNCHETKEIAKILTQPQREEEQRRRESERIANALTPQQRVDEWIVGSAVNQSITAANIKHIEDKPLIAGLLGWKWYSHTPGWYVLSCDPITGKRGKDGQFKPDTPIKFPDQDEPQKYLSFPKGGKSSAVYLVLTLDDWIEISEKFGVAIADEDIDESRDDLGFWLWVLNHPELPITFTEGAKKAGCLLAQGWIAISISGVWSGQVGKGKKLHPSIAPFIVPGRRVCTAFDSDILKNPNVEGALRQLGHLVKREKSEVFICQWELDQGKGIDDFIVSGGDFQAVIEGAIAYSQWLKSLQADNGSRGNGSGSGSSGGGDGGGGGDDHTPDPSDKHPEAFYRPICKSKGLNFENCVTAGTFDNWSYRSEFGATEGDWRVIDSAFYRWLEDLGYWEHQTDNRINTLIADCGDKAFRLKHTKEFGWQIQYPYGTNSHKESAFKYCRSRLERPEALPSNTHLRAFKNCVVDLRTGARMPHDKAYYLTSIIPYDYEPGRECPEVFRQFIADSFGEDMLPIIRAFTSMFLDPTAPYGRFPHLIGQSGGGKGTLGRFWSSLFGEDGASSGDFSNLSSAEGRHQYLTGKSIFAIPDAGGYVSGLRAFYELVDNGGLSGRALFNPVGYFKVWNVRFWIASVDHLQIENAGDGWARRAYPIPVRPRTVRPDPDLRLKLEACKADVISWVLAMPREERNEILLGEAQNERVVSLQLDSSLYGDSTKSFVDLCLRPSDEPGFIPHHLLHAWYVAYCREHGYTPLGMTKFISHLKTVLPRSFVDRTWTPMINGSRSKIPAHWQHVTTTAGAFIDMTDILQQSNSSHTIVPGERAWGCAKSKCLEGGLQEFNDFWNSPPPDPDNLSDNNFDGGNPPSLPQVPPSPLQSGTGGTGWDRKSQIAEMTQNIGVQGGTGVQGGALAKEKNAVCLIEKTEVENEARNSLTSIEGGGQILDKVDSFNIGQNDAIQSNSIQRWCELKSGRIAAGKLKGVQVSYKGEPGYQIDEVYPEAGTCKLFNWNTDGRVTANFTDIEIGIPDQPASVSSTEQSTPPDRDHCMKEEELQAIAADLDSCPDSETLAILRECWPGYVMNAACKKLSPEKHAQIKQWVVKLNAANEVAVQSELPLMGEPEKLTSSQPTDNNQYRVHSSYFGKVFEPCLLLNKDGGCWLFRHIASGQELRIYSEESIELLGDLNHG